MARPASRRRREREEEDDRDRRGRGPAPRRPSGFPPAVLIAGVALLVGAAVLAIVLSKPKKPIAPPAVTLAPKPVKAEPEVVKTATPVKAPPKPLTDGEKAYIEGLFTKAKPHIEAFRRHADAGWELKKKEDNDGANEEWIDAKHEYQKAVEIVSEALEDEDRFASERPGMAAFNGRLATWTKEFSNLPKVNVTR
jgi:hypothetical protein